MSTEEEPREESREEPRINVFRELWIYAKVHRRMLSIVVFLSFIYTGTDLLYPLVYRDVVNDIAGLFVKQAYDEALEENSVVNDVIDELIGKEEVDSTAEVETDSTAEVVSNEAAQSDTAALHPIAPNNGSPTQVVGSPALQRHIADSTARHQRIVEKRNLLKQKAVKQLHRADKRQRGVQGAQGMRSDSAVAHAVPGVPVHDSTVTQPLKEAHGSTHIAHRTPDQVLHTMVWAVIILFALGMIGYALWMLGENISERVATSIEQSFLLDTFTHVLRLPFGFFRTRSSGVLTKQIDEADHISPIVTNLSKHVLPNAVKIFGTFFVMLALNSELTLIVLVTIPPYIWLVRYSSRKLESGLSTYYELWELISARLQNAMQSIKTVKLAGAEKREVAALKDLSDQAYTEYVIRTKVSNRFVFWDAFISHLGSAIVLIVGGYLALKRQLTPGDVVMFVVYVEELYSPIDELSSVWMELQQNIASFTRTFTLLKSGEEEKSGDTLSITKGLVEFQDVHFAYNAKRKILKGLSLTAKPGNITAIVGSSGAGKTTSMDLLLKLYEVNKGKICIDGQVVSNLDPASIRSHIGLVAADGTVFKMSLRDNINYSKDDATEEEIMEAVELAGLSPLLDRLPDGLDSEIGEGGIGLSVGERQRVQLARILLAKPPILVLDEATANLDFATEKEIRNTIQQFRKDRTVIIIAHRYSMVRDADIVYVLDDGKVAEQGSPAELANAKGWFSRFASSAQA